MPAGPAQVVARKPRADAQRNRLRLLETAKSVFAAKGSDVSLDEIAKAAGVGIGTLYRHFPTRDALVQEVYRNEAHQIAEAAETLSASQPPVEALRAWLRLFVDYLVTKRALAEALNAMVGRPSDLYATSGAKVTQAIAMLVDRAVASGDIRLEMEPLDLLRALFGVSSVSAGPEGQESAKRLIDILIAGMRVPAGDA